jgi:adenylosuccinate synthase
MAVDPLTLITEYETFINNNRGRFMPHLSIYVNLKCPVVTPYHVSYCKVCALIENKSTVGMGVGETFLNPEKLYIETLRSRRNTKHYLAMFKSYYMDKIEQIKIICNPGLVRDIENIYNNMRLINIDSIVEIYCDDLFELIKIYDKFSNHGDQIRVFEGAQGILLHKNRGFTPYVTQSKTTSINASKILKDADMADEKTVIVGVLRPYMTRHGKGPLPTENTTYKEVLKEKHNCDNQWQGKFRFGNLDLPLIRYALHSNTLDDIQVDFLALTNMDMDEIDASYIRVCHAYQYDAEDFLYESSETDIDWMSFFRNKVTPLYTNIKREDLPNFIKQEVGVPVKLISKGPTRDDKCWNF